MHWPRTRALEEVALQSEKYTLLKKHFLKPTRNFFEN